jgi:hypothetical protein
VALTVPCTAKDKKLVAIEGYPDIIEGRLRQRAHDLEKLPNDYKGLQPKLVIVKQARRWAPGQIITVAFETGSSDEPLRKKVEDAATIWMKFANVKFDFHDPNSKPKAYREFSDNDNDYSADIRISFRTGGGWEGYWSAVGNDSKKKESSKPWEPSMNLGGIELEEHKDLVGTVLHEFGHALGAEHEHQHPGSGCDDEWKWDDDPGYVSTTGPDGELVPDRYDRWPGIYTLMGGAPNYWSRSKIDWNLRQLRDQSAYDGGPFDKLSIMKYFFRARFFKRGEDSPCFTKERARVLSKGDEAQIAEIYKDTKGRLAAAEQSRDRLVAVLKELRATMAPNSALDEAIKSLEKK